MPKNQFQLPSKQSVDGSNPSGGVQSGEPRDVLKHQACEEKYPSGTPMAKAIRNTTNVPIGVVTTFSVLQTLDLLRIQGQPMSDRPIPFPPECLASALQPLQQPPLDQVQILLVLSHPGNEVWRAVSHQSSIQPQLPAPLASWLHPNHRCHAHSRGFEVERVSESPPNPAVRMSQPGDCNQRLFLNRNGIMAKLLTLILILPALSSSQSVLASECFTISSNNDPSQAEVTCKRVARSSTNGIGFWRCCSQKDAANV